KARAHRVTTAEEDPAGDRLHRGRVGGGELGTPRDDLALEALVVEAPLPGDHDVSRRDERVEPDGLEDGLHPARPSGAEEHQRVADPTGGPGTGLAVEPALLAGEEVGSGGPRAAPLL